VLRNTVTVLPPMSLGEAVAEAAAEGAAVELIDDATDSVGTAVALVAVEAGEADEADIGVDAVVSKIDCQQIASPQRSLRKSEWFTILD